MAETLIDAGAEVFNYNREGWKFGAQLRQRDLYQRQKMRIKQVDLYREDMRDLFDLTVGKMDKYVIVCIVLLALVMELLYRGRSPAGTPSWLFWCWSICTAGAILYLFQSTWLALIASISAQSFSVRCLTQWLRLPIPSADEIMKGSSKLEDYESAGKLFRIPVLEKADEKANGNEGTNPNVVSGPHDLTTDWQLFTSHFDLFNHLHKKWQGYEAYARVCMCLGMNHFLTAMSYFSISEYGLNLQNPWAGLAFVTIFQGLAVIHSRLNLNLNFTETVSMVSLVVLPSLFICIAVAIVLTSTGTSNMDSAPYDTIPCALAITGILGHMLWILFFLFQTKSDVNGLPVKFSTVWCIDVLGFGMEILKEVQEPVGKSTYNSRLLVAEHAQSKPVNSFGLGETVDDEEVDGGEEDVVQEARMEEDSSESDRSRLPWVAFKIGSVCIVLLWLLALIHTVLVAAHVDTGIASISNAIAASNISNRRLMEVTDDSSITSATRTRRQIIRTFSMRGIHKDELFATEVGIFDVRTFERVSCDIPETMNASDSLIHDIDKDGEDLFVLTRDSRIIFCGNNNLSSQLVVKSNTGKIDSFSVSRDKRDHQTVHVYALMNQVVSYLAFDIREEPRWVPLVRLEGRSPSGFSISVDEPELTVLNVVNQELSVYDLDDLEKEPMVFGVKDDDYYWVRVSHKFLGGVSRRDNSRIIAPIS